LRAQVSFLVLPVVVALLAASLPASALDRNEGDYWVYSISVVVPGYSVSATGTVRYEFLSEGTIVVNNTEVSANVMRVTGSAAGSVSDIDLSVSIVFEGYVYEDPAGMGVLRSDLTYWTSVTWGSGPFALQIDSANRSADTFIPSLLAGLEPGEATFGASWIEDIRVESVTYNLTTGAAMSSDTYLLTASCSAGAELETVSTGAGEFEALEITATESGGGVVVCWWSEEIAQFAKLELYSEEASEPVMTLTLKDYGVTARTDVLVFVAVGGVAFIVALVALALVMVRRRPPKTASQDAQPLELLQPPP